MFAVKRLYHGSPASSTPHQLLSGHPHPPLSSLSDGDFRERENAFSYTLKHILMPLVSVLLPGQQNYLEWKAVIHGKEIPYGLFLGEVVNFLIIAVVIFLFIVKFLGWLMQTKHEEAVTPPPPTPEQVLLTEIRDLLKEGVHGNGEHRT